MKKILLLLTVLVSCFAFGTACGGDLNSSASDSSQGSQTIESGLKTMNVSLSSKSFDYDGSEHSLTIDGELPEKAVVTWQNNSLKDVGERTVFATVRCQGYKDVSLKATLTVVGQDMPNELALKNAAISVDYGAAYAFEVNDESLLPEGYSLVETYVDMSSGEVVDQKPDFGGNFRYVLQISAPGYNTKVIHGDLAISRPDAVSVEIINLPSVPIAKYTNKAALLPNMKWIPEVEILPKGHKDVELVFTTNNDSRIQFENGAFVALENFGDCKITVAIKGTEISKTYTVSVPECSYYYEDFEDESKTLYTQQFVMEKNELGQDVPKLDENGAGIIIPKDENEEYFGAFASVGTTSEIISQNGNQVLHVTGVENFNVYYSYFEIDATPTDGWTTGTYRLEMDVTGDYAFTFWWIRNALDGANYYLMANSGVLSNGEAVVQDGKVAIEFTLTESSLGDTNVIRFAQSSRNAFDFTVDNISIIKIQ